MLHALLHKKKRMNQEQNYVLNILVKCCNLTSKIHLTFVALFS